MGRESYIREMKEEAVEEVNYHQEEVEPSPNTEHQMTLNQYMASNGAIRRSPRITRRKTQELRMVCNKIEVPSSAADRAQEIRANLDTQYPSFVKVMLRSHVKWGFWLGLPTAFCRTYMPNHDKSCILEDEDGKEYEAKYLASKMGLSGGWRGFAVAHELREGDAVVYYLVLIVRGTSSGEVDGALGLLELDGKLSERNLVKGELTEGKTKRSKRTRRNRKFNLKDAEECEISTSFVDFEDFRIIVNGIILDSLIPESIRLKYYELCRARQSYLHAGLLETISSTSSGDIISDTVKVADAIKSSNISTPQSDFALWDKTLAGFELLGIEVGFLRDRVSKLTRLSAQLGETSCAKRYKQAKLEYDVAEKEIKTLEARLQEAQQMKTRCYFDLELLNKYVDRDESRFLEEANSPW